MSPLSVGEPHIINGDFILSADKVEENTTTALPVRAQDGSESRNFELEDHPIDCTTQLRVSSAANGNSENY
jgi:hypothetical protein